MITPEQFEEISFGRATFGGYDMNAVDNFLDELTKDYTTLYEENAQLKSKLRILVSKLQEYRNNEEAMKEAIAAAQNTCDTMVRDTEQKCAQMLAETKAAADEEAKKAAALMEAENIRVEEARRVAADNIDRISDELNTCLQLLNRIKAENPPAPAPIYDFDQEPDVDPTDAMADEISQSLENLVGFAEDPLKANDKFEKLDQYFGNKQQL